MQQPLWTPRNLPKTQIVKFFDSIEGCDFQPDDYAAMHRYSIEHPEEFWRNIWQQFNLIGEGSLERIRVVKDDTNPIESCHWFPDVTLNFAENLLKADNDALSIQFYGEDNSRAQYTKGQLRERVLKAARFLEELGVGEGDRVAGFVPNHAETIVMMLATVTLGGVWTSCSPDFGENGVVDRFGQTEPKVLIMADGYFYNGKVFDCIAKANGFLQRLPSIKHIILFHYAGDMSARNVLEAKGRTCYELDAVIEHYSPLEQFKRVAFNAPLFILYSSGTTGAPKCIVHSVGGTLIQHVKEHRLHSDINVGDKVFYFTTCGWMMWNWLVSALASDAALILYDGSPFYPNPNRLFDLADEVGMTHFGTSAKYIDACSKEGLVPKDSHKLSALRCILSTGSPLVAESFEYVYSAIKSDIHLASISGGTDIVSCFVLGAPNLPVYSGEIQVAGLGLDVQVLDDNGGVLPIGEKGELSCAQPFPSQPIGFFNDEDGVKYHNSYFNKIDGIWCHGDFMFKTEHHGYVILGRSDAVLNPGGVRIGTAEIYRQVEQFDEVVESIVIGQHYLDDVRVVLFVRLREGLVLHDELISNIKSRIRNNTTARHVPAKIISVRDIPRTRSGKIVELAVRNTVHNQPVKNVDALANPEALELFRNLKELST